MGAVSKMDARGRVTIPSSVRNVLGIKPGDKLTLTVLSDGTIIVGAILQQATELMHLPTHADQPLGATEEPSR